MKEPAPLACKTDRIDAWVLAELSRRDLVPAIWLPDPAVRAERERAPTNGANAVASAWRSLAERTPGPYLGFSVVEPFEPPHAMEFKETNAVVGVTKCPAIFQSFNLLVYAKRPVLSTGRL